MKYSGTYTGKPTYSGKHYTELVAYMPVRLKKAIVAAAQAKLLQRSTWNGCVFNGAGAKEGHQVWSSDVAARTFDIPFTLVNAFISSWDGASKNESLIDANAKLIKSITDYGVFNEPTKGKFAKSGPIRNRIVKSVFKSPLSELNREFEDLCQNVDITRPTDQQSDLEKDVCELVSVLS